MVKLMFLKDLMLMRLVNQKSLISLTIAISLDKGFKF